MILPSRILISTVVLLITNSVCGQRTSPQFSFPAPGALASQFGADVFASSGQDLGPIAPPPPPPPPQQPQPAPGQASSQVGGGPQQPEREQPQPQLSRPSLSLSSLSQPAPQQPVARQSVAPQVTANHRDQQQQPQQQQSARHQAQSGSSSSSSSSSSASSSSSSSNQHRASQSQHHPSSAAAPKPSASHQSQQQQSQNQHHQHHNSLHTQQTSQAAAAGSNQAAIEAARKAEATAASLAAAGGSNYRCPDSFGYFRHHKSCDKYYACENGTATLKLCGNGLMFDDSDPKRENCAYPFSVDCGADRTDLEPPISTPHCPRLYGLFADTTNCRVFYSCWNGESSKYECPPGLAYDNEQRVCVWADLVDRCDQSEVSDGFVCPDPSEADQPGHYTRHAHPTDCRKFYVCIEGVARPYGCSFGSVFNVDSLQCDEPENVSGCEKYYGELDPKLAKKLARENAQGQPQQQSSSSSRQSSGSSAGH